MIADDGNVATPDSQSGEFNTISTPTFIIWTVNGDSKKKRTRGFATKPGTSYAYQQPESGSSHKKLKPIAKHTSVFANCATGSKPPVATKLPESSKKLDRWVRRGLISHFAHLKIL